MTIWIEEHWRERARELAPRVQERIDSYVEYVTTDPDVGTEDLTYVEFSEEGITDWLSGFLNLSSFTLELIGGVCTEDWEAEPGTTTSPGTNPERFVLGESPVGTVELEIEGWEVDVSYFVFEELTRFWHDTFRIKFEDEGQIVFLTETDAVWRAVIPKSKIIKA